jgi:methionyl-tRNA formyltransferase
VKIEFLTEDDSNYILPFFDEFVNRYGNEFRVQQISCCRAMGSRSRAKLARELLWLYGPYGFLRVAARSLFGHLMAIVPAGEKTVRPHSIAQLCRAHQIRYQRVKNPNSSEFVRGLRERAPDLLVSVACPYILKEPILQSTPSGCINIHNAPLPKYKGMMPVFWQMYHGEKKIGVTIHYMAAKVDEGVAILQDEWEILPGESLHNLMRRSKRLDAHCMARALRQIQNSKPSQGIDLNHSVGSYFTFPTREQIRDFRNRGLRTI